jgi:hypothetical protein
MVRSDYRRRWIIFACVIVAVLTGCEVSQKKASINPPNKPANVPQEAVWSGGANGGAFIYLRKNNDSPPHIYSAEIYYDSTGEIWYKGQLKIEPVDNPQFDWKNKDVYSGWDGDTLYLKDGRLLKAIDTNN